MSTVFCDISYELIEGIFTVLDGNVTYGGTTYPVYKSVPKIPASVYVHISGVSHMEDGTKDDFIYSGTVQIEVVDESKERADKKLAQKILNVIRGLLKASKASVFSVTGLTLVVFSHNTFNDLVEQADNGILRIRLIDIYNFIIQ